MNRYAITIIVILIVGVIGAYYYLQIDQSSTDVEPTPEVDDREKQYTLNLDLKGILNKTDRWRFYLILNFSNAGEETFSILWLWLNTTRVKYVDDTIFWIGVTGNFTNLPTLDTGEFEAFLAIPSEYGFIKEPTDIWLDVKIKIHERAELWEFEYHISVPQGDLIKVSA